METRRHRSFLVLALLCSVALRLILSSDRDILALNQPYDDYWFVTTANRWIYGGAYNHMAFAQLSLYSWWLKGVSLLGVPARLAIDLAWISASLYLAFAVAQLLKSRWAGLLVYLFLAFHPYGLVLFDRALSENLMGALSAAALGGFIELWNLRQVDARTTPRWLLAAATTSLGFAAAFHIRKEGMVLLPPLLILLAWSAFRGQAWWGRQQRARMAYPMLVYPLATTLALGFLLAGASYLRWGVFARYELAAPSYVRALNSLNAIDPGAPTPKYVTVTAKMRRQAYAVSPTFRELERFLEGPVGQEAAKPTALYFGIQGEIGNGWFYWVFRDVAAMAGWHLTARTAEQKYSAMADEMEQAFADGRVPRRPVFLSLVDPDWHKWLPLVPAAFWGEIRQVVDPTVAGLQTGLLEDAKPDQFDKFISVAGRRRPAQRAHLAGWLIAPEGSSISFGSSDQSHLWQPLQGPYRPDVPNARAFKLDSDAGAMPTELHVRDPGGTVSHVSLDGLKVGMMKSLPGIPGGTLGVDVASFERVVRSANAILPTATRIWGVIGWLFVVAGVTGMATGMLRPRRAGNLSAPMLIALLTLVAIMARVVVLALVDASSWSGLQTRYVFPVVPCFAVFGVLGLWLLAERITATRQGSRESAR